MATGTGVQSTKERMRVAIEEVHRIRGNGSLKAMPPPLIVEGIPLPHELSLSLESFQELRRSLVANLSDVFVVTYPKCGTTWMQQIVTLIRNNGVDDGVDLDEGWLWIELFTAEEAEVS